MDLKVVHDFIRYIINKEQGGWLAPEEIDVLLHRSQMWRYNQAQASYAMNQDSKDSLSVFSNKLQFTSVAGGLIQLPLAPLANPYENLLSLYIQYYDNTAQRIRTKPVKILVEDEVDYRLNSQVLEPTITDPFGEVLKRGQIQLYPQVPMSGYCYYLATPQPPVFSYTMSGRVLTYNLALSTQLLWSESNMNKIMFHAIQLAGINLSDQLIIQYTSAKEQQDI